MTIILKNWHQSVREAEGQKPGQALHDFNQAQVTPSFIRHKVRYALLIIDRHRQKVQAMCSHFRNKQKSA